MKYMIAVAALSISTPAHAQNAVRSADPAPAAQEQAAPASDGLADLARITFGCPRAALNAAAREAAKIPAQGTYQFSYFRIVNDSHHASFEVHFKSNYEGETDLKYCVSMYCQQGWDPRTTKTTVKLMGTPRQLAPDTAHEPDCGMTKASGKAAAPKRPVQRPAKK